MEKIILEQSELVHGNWHVAGSRKLDALISMFKSLDNQTTFITDDRNWQQKLEAQLPEHIIKFGSFKPSVVPCVYILRAVSGEHASDIHSGSNGECVYTLAVVDDKKNFENTKTIPKVNTIHVLDGTIIGVSRYGEVCING